MDLRENLNNILKIRYTKITFTVQFLEDTRMPEQKASALRGGIGEMLLRTNCIRDRNCAACDFESECIVQRTMYSKFDIKPDFVTTGESIGYVMECEDYRSHFREGDKMKFTLLLFGKTIVYFSQYLQAIYTLGQYGVGKEKSKYQIVSVTNSHDQQMLVDGDILMARYEVETVGDYVKNRREYLQNEDTYIAMVFQTPLTMKYRNEFIHNFKIEAIISGITRRLHMMDCFEGIEEEQIEAENLHIPEVVAEEVKPASVRRFSNRQKMSMDLKGIKGVVILNSVDSDILDLLLAGELIHIGKNTSFGFGKYMIKMLEE